jgi:hypothetical protein
MCRSEQPSLKLACPGFATLEPASKNVILRKDSPYLRPGKSKTERTTIMTEQGLETIETTVQKTHEGISRIAESM